MDDLKHFTTAIFRSLSKNKGKKICACQQESKNTENKYVWDSMFVAIEACKTSFKQKKEKHSHNSGFKDCYRWQKLKLKVMISLFQCLLYQVLKKL